MPTLLVIIPHPDDEAYAFAGTMALAAGASWRIVVECATDGEQGERHDGPAAEPESLGRRRREELRESCRILGAEPPRFWGLPDGGLAHEPDQSERIAGIIRAESASMVLSLGADGAYGHPDHLAVHRWVSAAVEGLGTAAPPLLFANFPAGLFVPQWELCLPMLGDPPQPPATALGSNFADIRLRITAVRAQKLAALGAHRTQLAGGDPAALFPGGIINRLLDEERFVFANEASAKASATLLRDIAGA